MPVFRGDQLEAEFVVRGCHSWGEFATQLGLGVDALRAARRGEPVRAATAQRILDWLHETPPRYPESAGLIASGGRPR